MQASTPRSAPLRSAPPPPPHPLPPPPLLHHQTHRSPVTPFTFLRWPRPLLGFVQIGLFASPELPIQGRRHQRVEGRADVERESPGGEGTGEGGGEFLRHSHSCEAPPSPSPSPSSFTPLPPFYVGVGALGAPLLRWSPRLYKRPASRVPQPDLRFPDSKCERRLPQPPIYRH